MEETIKLNLNKIADLGLALAAAAKLGYDDERVGHTPRTAAKIRAAIPAINAWRGGHEPCLRPAYMAGRFTAEMERKEALAAHKKKTA